MQRGGGGASFVALSLEAFQAPVERGGAAVSVGDLHGGLMKELLEGRVALRGAGRGGLPSLQAHLTHGSTDVPNITSDELSSRFKIDGRRIEEERASRFRRPRLVS